MADLHTAFAKYGTSLKMGRVDGYNTTLNDGGDDMQDSAGNFIPTGLLDITLLSPEETKTAIPFAVPATGSSTFMGSLPEIGSLCIVGFFDQNNPVILGFLPKNLSNLIGARGVLPNLQPGEVLLQASTSDSDADGNDQQFVGASVKLDAYGRYIVKVQDYTLTVGYLLSNENTPDVTSLNDPITGEAIYLHETGPGGSQRRLGAGGSSVTVVGQDKVERIGNNVDTQIEGAMVVIARAGQMYQDRRGNSFGIDPDGNIFMEAQTGGYSVDVQGTFSQEVAQSESYNTARGYKRVVGADHVTQVGGNKTTVVGNPLSVVPNGEVKFVAGVAGSQEYVNAGAKLISSLLGVVIQSIPAPIPTAIPLGPIPLLPGGVALIGTSGIALWAPHIFLGGPPLALAPIDPVVKFIELAAILTPLLTLLATSPTGPPGTPLLPAAAGLSGLIPTIASGLVSVFA